jgi:hypothetical protein
VPDFILVCATAAVTTAFAAWLVQRSGQPMAGSGIPHVEAVTPMACIDSTFPKVLTCRYMLKQS